VYERVETSDFTMHRVINDDTNEIEQLGFELDGRMLSYREFIAHRPGVRIPLDAAPEIVGVPASPRIWLYVALSSTITGTAFAVVSHLWR
jgi:hypothetical protein